MSLPSLVAVAQEMKLDLTSLTPQQQEELLVATMKRDLPLGCQYLHQLAHRADELGGSAAWLEDPKSNLGKELIRIHASDALRSLASKHICHGKQLTFVNCCGGVVGNPPENVLIMQIEHQSGTVARPDC
jgi:hypothetical protein